MYLPKIDGVIRLSGVDKELIMNGPPIHRKLPKMFTYSSEPGLPVVPGMAACPHGDETRECAACAKAKVREWLAWRDGV